MELVIVTGMSGAGKTQVANALEDVGYYCVDNVPPQLLVKFAELPTQTEGKLSKIALVVDVRSRDMFAQYFACLQDLTAQAYKFKTVFLDCDDKVLLRRYKETRRRHPLLSNEIVSVQKAIAVERDMLDGARSRADYVIDTTYTSPAQVRERIRDVFSDHLDASMVVSCLSFGFKFGIPVDADLVFDVRCLPNPFYQQDLKDKNGLDEAVREYVLGFPQATGLIPKLLSLIDYLVPLYIQEGKSQLVVAIGCTGGKHRSVVFTQLLAEHLKEKRIAVNISHRDITAFSRK